MEQSIFPSFLALVFLLTPCSETNSGPLSLAVMVVSDIQIQSSISKKRKEKEKKNKMKKQKSLKEKKRKKQIFQDLSICSKTTSTFTLKKENIKDHDIRKDQRSPEKMGEKKIKRN